MTPVGHGFVDLGADHSALGWKLWAEAGERMSHGAIFGDAWWSPSQDAAGVGVGYRW